MSKQAHAISLLLFRVQDIGYWLWIRDSRGFRIAKGECPRASAPTPKTPGLPNAGGKVFNRPTPHRPAR